MGNSQDASAVCLFAGLSGECPEVERNLEVGEEFHIRERLLVPNHCVQFLGVQPDTGIPKVQKAGEHSGQKLFLHTFQTPEGSIFVAVAPKDQ